MNNLQTYSPTEENKVGNNIYKTSIDGLYFIKNDLLVDDRGFFRTTAILPDLNEMLTEKYEVKQLNHSRSEKNVVRGMHAEGWNKLISLVSGKCFCALADIRPDSSTFKKVEYFLLGTDSDSLIGSLYVEKGIANSYCVVEGPVDYFYCFDKLYRDRDPAGDKSISIFDPDLNITWPIEKEEMIISERDKNCITLRELYPDKF
jgi:dTDP-4-dehydrorhamnose 3,5-epimerase